MRKLSGLLFVFALFIFTPFVLSGCGEEKVVNTGNETFEFPEPDPQVIGAWISVAWPLGPTENPNQWTWWQDIRTEGASCVCCNGRQGTTHSGADYMARDLNKAGTSDYGKSVFAGINGRIVQVVSPNEYNGGYGGTVVVYDHSRRVALRFSHLSKTSVSIGQIVDFRQKIGEVGDSGNALGPHLHLAAYENIDHFVNGDSNRPVVPRLCDSQWYTCGTYFYCWY